MAEGSLLILMRVKSICAGKSRAAFWEQRSKLLSCCRISLPTQYDISALKSNTDVGMLQMIHTSITYFSVSSASSDNTQKLIVSDSSIATCWDGV